MTDDGLTPREAGRAIARLETADQALAAQITRLATELLPVALWNVQHKALVEHIARVEQSTKDLGQTLSGDVDEVRKEIRDLRDETSSRAELTWQKAIGLISALAALALVVVTLLGQSKGIH